MKKLKGYNEMNNTIFNKIKELKPISTKTHRIELEKMFARNKQETEEAIRLAVKNNTQELYASFKNRLWEATASMSSNSATSDQFYESMFTPFFGEKDKYALENAPKRIQESVKYAKAKGYITVYNTPLAREQEDAIREYAQTIAYIRAFEDPIVGAIPDSLQRFVLGRGLKYKFSNRDVQNVVDEFWSENNMEMVMKSFVWLLITESELFPIYFISTEGKVAVREVQPAEITEIETSKDDKDTIVSYKREFLSETGEVQTRVYPDIKYYIRGDIGSAMKNSKYGRTDVWQGEGRVMQFVKFMKNREVRGRVYLERVLRWAEFYKQWILDRAIINHEKSRVVWKLMLKGSRDDVWERYKTPPAGGTVRICTPDRDWSPINATIGADDAKEDGLFLLYQVAAGSGIPIHVLTQRTTEQVYSGIRASDSPFSQFILDIQDSLADGVIKPMFKVVIRAALGKKLKPKIKVKQFVREHIRDIFRLQFDRYMDGTLPFYKMVRTIKILTESAVADVENSKHLKESAVLCREVFDKYESLLNLCKEESLRVIENESYSNKTLILKAADVFENGIDVEIPTIDIPVDVIFPDMVREDLKQSAEILKIHRELGIVSKTTASAKAGYNPEQEKYLISTENFGEPEKKKENNDPLEENPFENGDKKDNKGE